LINNPTTNLNSKLSQLNISKPADPSSIRSVRELTASIGAGGKFKYLYFWRHTGNGVGSHCLSQWYPSEFQENKLRFKSAEHYMMYRKAQLFSDDKASALILAADNPGEVQALGRKIANFEEAKWESSRFDIVVKGNLLKFGSNPELLEYFLNTNPRILVEASPRDRIWGIGMDATTTQASNPFKWRGQNLLGFALMEARERLLATAA